MISPDAAWRRLSNYPMFRGMKLSDFRPIAFGQLFQPTSLQTLGPIRRDFPGGAVVLGITGGAIENGAAFANDSTNNRTAFAAEFAYTNDEVISPGGPIMAEALIGGADSCQFPPREIVVAPTQGINTRIQNLTTTTLDVHLAYHCLVWRFAS